MFDALRKKLEEVVADVNPFDNGQTGEGIRNDRDRAHAAAPNLKPVQHEGGIPKTQQPYSSIPMRLGTVDKPIRFQERYRAPSSTIVQIPENIYPRYSIYNNPNTGRTTLENDDDGDAPSIPYEKTQPLPDQPYNFKPLPYQPASANPQLRRNLETKIKLGRA